ncbi:MULTISPECIES: Rid family hydrolase [unclassified Streptomyces]|uniref:RidA family protein n=1 Tax=unclassified Streptomyces TaxID=2593676 RepID=UPI0033240E28
MTARISRINPDQLHETPGYHHITVVEAGRTAYPAGRCPLDQGGSLVGAGSLDVQVDQVIVNALTALAAVGGQPQHVVRSVIYVRSDDRGGDRCGTCSGQLVRQGGGGRVRPVAHG